MNRLRLITFRFFEQRRLRDWFYTVAFVIFVPVGFRFAALAWRYGSWFDKPLAVIAGAFIGITTVVTLMRFWSVPPQLVVTPAAAAPVIASKPAKSLASDLVVAARHRAAKNRAMATSAGALGSTMGRGWQR